METNFYGQLDFTRPLNAKEIFTVASYININLLFIPAYEAAPEGANLAPYLDSVSAKIIHPIDWNAMGYATHLRISDDRTGLVYCGEDSRNLISGVNFIVQNTRRYIPDFGLKGSLFAVTEFEPYYWLLKIGEDGLAYQEPSAFDELGIHDPRAYIRYLRNGGHLRNGGPKL